MKYLNLNWFYKSTSSINCDDLISNDRIDEVKKLIDEGKRISISPLVIENLYSQKKYDLIEYLHFKLKGNISFPSLDFHLDIALEEGNTDEVKLLTKLGGKYSLYAKQMSLILKPIDNVPLVLWVERYGTKRNDISVDLVHKKYNLRSKEFQWDSVIPEQVQY
jgi:hypothetical protein